MGLVVVGLGLPVGARVARSRPGAIRVSLWAGLAIALVVISIISLFSPLRSLNASAITVGLAVIAAGVSIPLLRRMPWSPRRLPWTWLLVFGGSLAIAAPMWAVSISRAPTNYDTGLYHFNAIEYVSQAGSVPGLANLFAPLGYGNAQFPLAAFFTNGPLGPQGFEAVNSFLLLLLWVDLLLRTYSRPRPGLGALVLAAGIFAIYPPMIAMADAWVISPTSDTAVLVLTLSAASTLAPAVQSGRITTTRVLLISSPLAVAAAMRPQAWVMFAGVALALIFVRYRLSPPDARARLPLFLASGLIPPVAIASVGFARDAVLSGWWLYPVNRFPLPVEWRAPDPSWLLTLTLGIARAPGPEYQQAAQGYGWVFPWALGLPQTWEFWMLGGLMVSGGSLVVIAFMRGQGSLTRLLLAAAPALLASIVWFLFTPPSFRFGWGPLFALVAIVFGWGWKNSRWADAWVLLLGGSALALTAVATAVIRIPSWPMAQPIVRLDQVSLPSNVELLVPAQGDQCWTTFPLCTPNPNPQLLLRGDKWESGFELTQHDAAHSG